MKLLQRRNRRQDVLGKVTFALAVRAQLSPERQAAINKYCLDMLYEKSTLVDPGQGPLGLASRVAFRAMGTSLSVRDLVGGMTVECKDIVEMLAVEEQSGNPLRLSTRCSTRPDTSAAKRPLI